MAGAITHGNRYHIHGGRRCDLRALLDQDCRARLKGCRPPDPVIRHVHPWLPPNPQVLEKYLDRYIPRVTVIGGVFIGVLSVVANLFGVIGSVSGTGLLLTVSITYRLYEEIASQQIMEMYPFMRTFFGKE